MKRIDTSLAGVCILEHAVHKDNRGSFTESYNQQRLAALGIHCTFVQDNHSVSEKDVIRGLHFQAGIGQMKLVRCTKGKILDIVVDIRPNSPTFKKWLSFPLEADDNKMIFIPVGYAHGFCVLEGPAEVQYKCSSFYDAPNEKTIRYDDTDIGVRWPIQHPIVSDRDKLAPSLKEVCKY